MRITAALTLLLPLLGVACATIATPLNLTASQLQEADAAQDYLNSLTTFKAQFTQSGFAGPGAGVLWLARPGRLRVTYYGPSAREMVATGGLFVIYDHATGATTTMPVARTPLGLLLAPHIALNGTVAVTGLNETPDQLDLTLQDRTRPEQGTLTVQLARRPWRLVGVIATDIHQRTLAMQLTGLDLHPLITPALFAPADVTHSAPAS